MYRLLFHRNVEKQLAKIPRSYARRIAEAIRELSNEPRSHQTKHLDKEMHRLRIGDYRIVYAIFDAEETVFIGKVGRRSKMTYKDVDALLKRAYQIMDLDQ